VVVVRSEPDHPEAAMTATNDLVTRYFTLVTAPDREPYFAQFTADAVVEDEGHEYKGVEAIRAWRTSVPAVRYDVREPGSDGADVVAKAEITGDFPGSPVILSFRFTFTADERISALRITF
jgi:hypothetical protein